MAKTVADQFAETLAAVGVKRIYGIVGDSLNGLTDALRRQGKIEWVHVRHEEVAAFAAGAEAHLTGELGVCAGSCGPGNLHLINGLFDCHRSRVPVLAIAAQIPSAEIGAGYFQETHPETLFKECSHYCELVSGANQMPRALEVAMRGKEHVEWENPYDVGMTGLIGFSSGYYAMLDCDVLLMLGTDFPYRQFYPQGSGVNIAQVDIRAEQIGRRAAVDLAVVGDVRATIEALLPLLTQKWGGPHLAQAQQHYARARKGLDDLAAGTPGKGLIHPQQIAKAISDHAAKDAVFTCDVGPPTVWAARYLTMNGSRRLIGSFWHGSMANALAQGMGAQAAFPGRPGGSVSGEGGFAMLMGDFLSLVQLRLPVKVVVFDNGALGFIELEQKSSGFLNTGTELQNPNFAAMAEAIGVRGIRLEDPTEVDTGIAAAFAHDGPVLVDAVVNRTELAMPPSITLEMAKGFTLYMVKAIMSGRGDEIIDLARTNLWR